MTKVLVKRESPVRLVLDVVHSSRSWFNQLNPADQKYVREVVQVMRVNLDATPNAVAVALIKELRITRNRMTVAATLKEMLNAKPKAV
jgi:hypothetical protein